MKLRESLAIVGNNIEALDRTLETLGYKGDLKTVAPRGNRIVFFARDELRRFCLILLARCVCCIRPRKCASAALGAPAFLSDGLS